MIGRKWKGTLKLGTNDYKISQLSPALELGKCKETRERQPTNPG